MQMDKNSKSLIGLAAYLTAAREWSFGIMERRFKESVLALGDYVLAKSLVVK